MILLKKSLCVKHIQIKESIIGTIVLDESSVEVQYLISRDSLLAKVINAIGRIEYQERTVADSFVFLVHEIIEQMLSIKAGNIIYGRLLDLCGGVLTPENIQTLGEDEIRKIGTSKSKASYIKSLSNDVLSGKIDFSAMPSMTDKEVYQKLVSLKGIGNWTANMYLLFVLNRPDVLPYDDAAFLQSYCWLYSTDDKKKSSIEKRCQIWRPYSSTAARYLYRALDSGLTKAGFDLGDKK